MFVYYLVILLLSFLIYYYDYKHFCAYKKTWIAVVALILTLLAGLRYRIGIDTITYMNMFESFPKLYEISLTSYQEGSMAPLCFLFFSTLRTITTEFWIVQLLISFIINIAVLKTFAEMAEGKYFFTLCLVYFLTIYYALNCESLRESISIAIFLFSLKPLFNNQYSKYFLFATIAFLFHYGAILLFFIPFAKWMRINIVFIILLPLIFACIYSIQNYFYLLQYVSINPQIADKVQLYTEAASQKDISIISFNGIIMIVILPIIFKFVINKYAPKFNRYEFLLILQILISLSTMVVFILYRYNNYMYIFYAYYYICGMYVLIDKILKRLSIKRYFIYYVIGLTPLLYMSVKTWFDIYIEYPQFYRYELLNPYSSILDKQISDNREFIYLYFGVL